MKQAFVWMTAVSLVCTYISYLVAPESMAMHFSGEGVPDTTMTKTTAHLFMLGLYGFVFAVFFFGIKALRKSPTDLINIPNKEYWFSDENREQTLNQFESTFFAFGIATYLLFIFIFALVTQANLAEPVALNNTAFTFLMLAYVGYTIYWCMKTRDYI